jgi:putative ABC transport system permease protein
MYSDIRFALRVWRRRPVLAIAAILTLALGTGANTAIFSVIYAVMLKPLPYPEPGRLMQIWSADRDPNAPRTTSDTNRRQTAIETVSQWRRTDTPFEEMGCYRAWQYTLSGNREPERVSAAAIAPGFLRTLGIAPLRGRAFTDGEYAPGQEHAVILSDRLWYRWFAGDAAAIGRTVTLDGSPYTVVGVMAPQTRLEAAYVPEEPDIYTPFVGLQAGGSRHDFGTVVGRLKRGVTLAAAASAMESLSLRTQHERYRRGVNLVPLADEVANSIRPALLVLFGAAGCVLLIACANLANLILAQAASRQRELAIRAAMGAGRGRLARHLLAECFTLAAAGGAAGLAFAWWIARAVTALYPHEIPRASTARLEPVVFAFALLVAMVAAVLAGAVPAWRFSRPAVAGTLQEARHGAKFRGVLVAAQAAIALVLLVGAGLLLRSFALLRAIDPGFQRTHVLTAKVRLPERVYAKPEQRLQFARELLERVRAIPSVETAGLTNSMPLNANFIMSMSFVVEGGPHSGREDQAYARTVTPGYFPAMGIGLLAGRYLEARDGKYDAVVVNRAFALQYFGTESPIGRRLRFGREEIAPIVGVVPDLKDESLERKTEPEMYVPLAALPLSFLDLAIRSTADPAALTRALRAEVSALDRNQPVSAVKPMSRILDDTMAMPRFRMTLLGGFAAVALLLAAVGIYGVISYAVSLRTHEMGIRVAIGARPADVLRLVLRMGLAPPLAGLAAGIPLAAAATRALSAFLYGVRPTDAWTYGAVAVALTGVSLAAAWFPARRAMRVDPMAALRHE